MNLISRLVMSILAAIISSSIYATTISNIVVFGDSLSDGGNLPEVSTPFIDPNGPKVVSNTDAQFYVPISNPVDTSSTNATPPIISTSRVYHWPRLGNGFLSPQSPIKGQMRLYRSISWPQFLLSYAVQNQVSLSDVIVPSYWLANHTAPINASVNYAWGFALATNGCSNESYQPVNCTSASILAARRSFVDSPTKANRAALQIPGTPEQVNLFLQDYKQHKVNITAHTIFTFRIGGNNLIVANNAMQKGDFGPMISMLFAGPFDDTLKAIGHLAQAMPADGPKTYYVFNLANPALTPGYYKSSLAGLANFVVSSYDFWLNYKVEQFNKNNPNYKIKIIDVYSMYKKASESSYFIQHLGQACQTKNGDYTHATQIPTNNCAGYMFWNNVHPASPLHMYVAYQYLQQLMNGHAAQQLTTALDFQKEQQRLDKIHQILSGVKQHGTTK